MVGYGKKRRQNILIKVVTTLTSQQKSFNQDEHFCESFWLNLLATRHFFPLSEEKAKGQDSDDRKVLVAFTTFFEGRSRLTWMGRQGRFFSRNPSSHVEVIKLIFFLLPSLVALPHRMRKPVQVKWQLTASGNDNGAIFYDFFRRQTAINHAMWLRLMEKMFPGL